MERIDTLLDLIEEILDTNEKRHIVGGILVSVSLLFGGLAITVITIKKKGGKR